MATPENILKRLMAVIEDRKSNMPAGSYTTELLAQGPQKIRKKIIEEAAELFEAAVEPDAAGRENVVRESADLVYHLLVLLACRDIRLSDLEAELARREGLSGLEEKSQRSEDH